MYVLLCLSMNGCASCVCVCARSGVVGKHMRLVSPLPTMREPSPIADGLAVYCTDHKTYKIAS